MATDKKKTDAPDAQGDGAVEPAPGIPDPNPIVPDASTEPVTQAASLTAETVAPPLPADYEMPDDYANEDPIAQAKAWVEAHPGLAILGAAGVGLVAGRLVMSLFPDPEPPSISDRVEKRARQLQKEAKKRGKVYTKDAAALASTANDSLQESLHRAADALKDAASHVGDYAKDAAGTAADYAGEGYEKTKDLAETVADAAREALTGVLAVKIDDWVKKVRD